MSSRTRPTWGQSAASRMASRSSERATRPRNRPKRATLLRLVPADATGRVVPVHDHRRRPDLAAGPTDQFDAVIEATSIEHMPALAVQLAKPAGRVVYIGLSSTPSLVDTRDIAAVTAADTSIAPMPITVR